MSVQNASVQLRPLEGDGRLRQQTAHGTNAPHGDVVVGARGAGHEHGERPIGLLDRDGVDSCVGRVQVAGHESEIELPFLAPRDNQLTVANGGRHRVAGVEGAALSEGRRVRHE